MDVQMMSSKGSSTSSYLSVPTLFEHLMDVQQMSSKWSSTSSYLTDTTYVWTPHGRPNDFLKGIFYKFLFERPNPIWTPHGRARYVLKVIVYQFLFGWTNPVWTPQGRANDVLKGIACQFLFDWHNICLNTPWTSKWCPQRDPLQVPIWVSQPYLNTPWTCNRCPQSDRLPVPIWLAQNLFGHPMDVQNMFSKWSSTVPIWLNQPCLNTTMTCKRCPQRDRLPVPIWLTQHLFEHPMDVKMMSSKGSSSSSYLTDTTPVWTPHGRPNDVLKGILYKFLFECPNPIWTPHGRATDVLKVIVYQFLFDWHNTCWNTPWASKWCPQRDPPQVPIWVSQPYLNTPWTCKRWTQRDRLPVPIWLTQHLLEHPMNVQKMSSKWSSTSSYLTDTTSVWTPHGRPNDVLKGIVYQFLFDWHNTCCNTPWTSKWCPQRDPPQVPIWVPHPYLNTPWTCKRCPQNDRLPVPIWLTQHLLEHPMNVQKMSSKWSYTCSYVTNTKPVWTPQGHAKDILKGIVYQFLFDWHNICLNTPWTSKWCPQNDRLPVPIWLNQPCLNTTMTCKRCPQRDRLPVPIWLTQHLFEHPMDVKMMSSKGSSSSSYLTDTTPDWTPHGRPNDVLKGILYKFLFECPNPIWTPHGRATDVLKVIVYQFLFDWHNTCWNTPWASKWCPQRDPLQVPIWVSQPYLNTSWTCKRCPQRIVYQFLFGWHNTCLNTPWTSKRCPQSDRLPVPIWLTQHLFEHPMDVQMMSSKGSSTSSYLTDTTPVGTPHGRPNDVLKGILYKFLFECPNPIWTPHGRATDVLKMIAYLFLFD